MKVIPNSKFIRVFKDLHENQLTRVLKKTYMRLDNESYLAFQI